MKTGTKAALAFVVAMTLFLNAAHASSAVTLASPKPQHGGGFGQSVAISSTNVVVGAPGETGGGFSAAGHAYIIDTTANALTITLTSPNAEANGNFGTSVAISGTTVAVGAPRETANALPGAGRAYVFDATDGSLITTLTSPNAQMNGFFGDSVSISGTTVVVGAPFETANALLFAGNAYVFDAASGSLVSTLTSPNAAAGGNFGRSVAISDGDPTVVVGAPGETASLMSGAGHAYVFDAASGSLVSTLTSPNAEANGGFGLSVAISDPTVVVGAPGETANLSTGAGHAYIFDAASGSLVSTLTSPNAASHRGFGTSVAISEGDPTVVVGAPQETVSSQGGAGRAYTFDATTGTLIASLISPYAEFNGNFGQSVAISEGDPTVVVGAPQETSSGQVSAGNAYIF
jgi:hypothetical protein